ncbi:hypothetical protein PIB30_051206 [Stylosanthes scabra]|uniref:Uncharacterized protein n=1 Tax=Stylosanthes scabra TaxID=79078 RepID=A0ABU6ZGN4_9FABA|nr:hypothetical protein [Stylosanthes scabra]
MDKLANLSVADPPKSDAGKGLGQAPVTTSLGIFSQRRDLRIVDKKWTEVQELSVEIETQEPEIFKKQNEEGNAKQDSTKTVGTQDMEVMQVVSDQNEKRKDVKILKDGTNMESNLKKGTTRKWKRYAREVTIPKEQMIETNELAQKRKNFMGNVNNEEEAEPQSKKKTTTMESITAEAAEQTTEHNENIKLELLWA